VGFRCPSGAKKGGYRGRLRLPRLRAALLAPRQHHLAAWQQEVGGSSIEASKTAGHANTKITEEYTIVQLRRQDELTRRIQCRRAKAGKKALK
jgi:hypothetical protein